MTSANKEDGYALAGRLLAAINERNSGALQREFDIGAAVASEIFEEVDRYIQAGDVLSLAPLAQSAQAGQGGRPANDWFINHAGNLGMECVLLWLTVSRARPSCMSKCPATRACRACIITISAPDP